MTLTPREYDFLRILVQQAGEVLTHSQLLSGVSISADPPSLQVDMRQKLEADPERLRILLTETGIGSGPRRTIRRAKGASSGAGEIG